MVGSAIATSRRTIPASERTLEPTEVVVRFNQPVLKRCGGRMEVTAALLGLSRKGLYLQRQRFGIEPPESATVSV